MNYRTSAEEQTGLKKSVTDEVKDAGGLSIEQESWAESRGAQSKQHVTNLADC